MMKGGYLSVLLCLCIFANAQKVNVVSYIYEDDRFGLSKFTNVINADSTGFGIENGKYIFANYHKKPGHSNWVTNSFGMNSNANTSYKASVMQLEGSQDYSYGMALNVENGSNYILFGIASSGYYIIESMNNGVSTKVSKGWVKSSVVKSGYNVLNDLYVEKKGNQYQFFLNDVPVISYEISLSKFSPKVGIFASSNMKVAFDKLEVDQWVDQKQVYGKIVPGYSPSNKFPISSKLYPTSSKKSELYSVNHGAFEYWYGIIDKDGYRVTDPVFRYAYQQGDWVVGGVEATNTVGVFDWQGNIIIPPIMQKINSTIYNGTAYFSCRSASGLWGLMDQNGKTLLPFVYSYIDLVSEGYVYMKNSKGWGVADLTGAIKVNPGSIDDADEAAKRSFRFPVRVRQGQFIAKASRGDGGKKGVMDVQGKWVVMPKYFDIDYVDTNQSYIVILPKPKDPNRLVKGVIDKNGREIIPAKYSTLIAVGKNYIVAEGDDPLGDDKIETDEVEDLLDYLDEMDEEEVEDNRKWGVISASGNELVPLKYSDITMSADVNVLQLKQMVTGAKKHTLSLFDQSNKSILNLAAYEIDNVDSILLKEKPRKDYRRNYSFYADGLINVAKLGKWGFLDKSGKIQIPFQFDFATGFSNGKAMVKKNKDWYYIDRTGKRMPDTEIQKTYSDKELPPIR